MKRILLVDDEPDFRNILADIISRKGFRVHSVGNPIEAQVKIREKDYDLIISDFKMPSMSGIELFHWVNDFKPTPFMLITGLSHIISTNSIQNLGINGFLAKPFCNKELFESVSEIFENLDQDKKLIRNQFSQIPITSFICKFETPYSIYLRTRGHQYIKISNGGEYLDEDRIFRFLRQGARFLYIKTADRHKFISYNLSLYKSLSLSKGISKIKTKILIYDLGKIIFDEICARGLSNLYFDYSKAFLKLAVDNLVSDPEVFCLLQQLQGQTNSTYLHCLSVSLLSFLVAREIGLYSDEQQFDIALGGFYHDIGKVSVHLDKYPDVPGAHAKANVSASQDHSQKGFELLNSIDSISKEILSIILLHEDSPNQDIIKFDNGSFYPVYLVSVINQFCNLIAKEKHYALSYKSINQKLLSKSIDIDLETLCAIKTVFKNSQYNELNNIEYGGERWPRS